MPRIYKTEADSELYYLVSEKNEEARDLFFEKYDNLIKMKAAKYKVFAESKGIDLSQNPSILNLMESITKNSDDINKNYKSIIDIRDMLITHDNDKQMVEIKKKISKIR